MACAIAPLIVMFARAIFFARAGDFACVSGHGPDLSKQCTENGYSFGWKREEKLAKGSQFITLQKNQYENSSNNQSYKKFCKSRERSSSIEVEIQTSHPSFFNFWIWAHKQSMYYRNHEYKTIINKLKSKN